MRKGVLELCVLLVIDRGEVYANDILQELRAAEMIVVEGTLYPLLSRLKNDGLVSYNWSESKSGPPRKYYSLTAEGRHTLQAQSGAWKELAASMNALIKKYSV
ncbi:MAG: hypothetical protein RL141_258 [Candidatus Parcubacteria bacterium]